MQVSGGEIPANVFMRRFTLFIISRNTVLCTLKLCDTNPESSNECQTPFWVQCLR